MRRILSKPRYRHHARRSAQKSDPLDYVVADLVVMCAERRPRSAHKSTLYDAWNNQAERNAARPDRLHISGDRLIS